VPCHGASREQLIEVYELCRAEQPEDQGPAAPTLHSRVKRNDEIATLGAMKRTGTYPLDTIRFREPHAERARVALKVMQSLPTT
jgi:hypothetical protein